MRLELVCGEEWTIAVDLDARVHEALELQRERALQADSDYVFSYRLSLFISKSIAEFLDADLHLPTRGQIAYATDIAREIGISLPVDVLRYRGSAHEFISRFENAFKVSRQRLGALAEDPKDSSS